MMRLHTSCALWTGGQACALPFCGMSSLVKAEAVRFDKDSMTLDLSDRRRLGVPLAWFPRLLHATPAQRDKVTISTRGLHWEELDEDISVEGLLAGRGDGVRPRPRAA